MAVTERLALTYADLHGDAPPAAPAPGHARFMAAHQLPQRWQGRRQFTVVDTGFGSGQTFLATWAAWRADPARSRRLTFVAFAPHPWHPEDLRRHHTAGPHPELARALIDQWPLPCRGPHLRHFDDGRVTLLLWLDDVATALASADTPFDACHLAGLDPAAWPPTLIQHLARQARPGATVACDRDAASVRDALTASGATLAHAADRPPGAMLHGTWTGDQAAPARPTRSVAVLGAGLAGCSVARALARHGVAVTVFDPAAHAASGASAAPRMVVRPWLTRRPTTASNLSVQGFLHAVTAYRGHPAWQPCGVHQRSKPGDAPLRMAAALAEQGWPAGLLRQISAPDADPAWFEAVHGGALDAAAWCAAQLDHPDIDVRLSHAPTLAHLHGRFDAVVIACAGATPAVLGRSLPLSRTRGQTTTVAAAALHDLHKVRCGDGYVAPLPGGRAVVGASYDRDDDPEVRPQSHLENLERLQRLTGAALTAADVTAGWVGFRAAWPDRLPAVGALNGLNGLNGPDGLDAQEPPGPVWLASGYASRGAVWAPLLGEVLAAQMLQRPVPLARDLQHALRATRFIGGDTPGRG